MRGAETFLSFIALMLATMAAFKMPRKDLPAILIAVLLAQVAFTLVPMLARQRLNQFDPLYTDICVGLGLIVLAISASFAIVAIRPISGIAIALPIYAVLPVAALLGYRLYDDLASRFLATMGFSFTVFGIVVLLSMVHPGGASWDAARCALAGFWIAEGLFHWFLPAFVAINYFGWMRRSQWIPALAAVVAFSWLAWKLDTNQRELSRQPIQISVPAPGLSNSYAKEGIR
jgi:hypothetical protein